MPLIPQPRRRSEPATVWPAIASVTVENLFGRYNYLNLDFRGNPENDVVILYGDNGLGKTTILKLIYSCLSPIANEGNRTYLANTRFSRISIRLLDGTSIDVVKSDPSLLGSYLFRVNDFELPIRANKENQIRVDDNPRVDETFAILRKIPLDILFLTDDRAIRSTYDIFKPSRVMEPQFIELVDEEFELEAVRRGVAPRLTRSRRETERPLALNLAGLIDALSRWLANKARQRFSSGDENASNVYLNIIRTLSSHGERRKSKRTDRVSLIENLTSLDETIKTYQKFGLVGTYPLLDFVKIVQEAPPERIPDIDAFLSPYIDSLITRIRALDDVRSMMSNFEDELNSYLRDKHVTMHVDYAPRFFDSRRTNISPADLSSGERQLLFLFCTAIMSRDENSLFIVDEPELSLNVKWQRRLVSSLSKLASGAATQFIFATHSIEIMAQQRRSVIELD